MSAKNSYSQLREQLPFTESTNFSYSLLDTETRLLVEQRTNEIGQLIHRSAQDIFDIGQKLIEVKEKLGHGRFALWLNAEFNWSESAARRFMQVAHQFKSVNFADLKIATSALYLLASNNNPPAARQEALKRAKQGERIDYTKAKSIVAQHKKTTACNLPRPITVDVSAVTVSEDPPIDQDLKGRELLGEEIDLKQIRQRAKELGLLPDNAEQQSLLQPLDPIPVKAIETCTKFISTIEDMNFQLLESMENNALKVMIDKSELLTARLRVLLAQRLQLASQESYLEK